MSIFIGDTEVFVRLNGEMVDAIVRAKDRATFEAAALNVGLLTEETDDEGQTFLKPGSGVHIDHIGRVELTPGEYDPETGEEITAPTYDTRHHANIRLVGYAVERLADDGVTPYWQTWAKEWTYWGQPDPQVNAQERGRVLSDVVLIDPDSIKTPSRVWAE